jgi:hypothetical protein
MRKWLALIVTLVLAGLIGWRAAQPPAPLPATAPADQFSAVRAMADVRAIASKPHPTGSVANDAARVHLVERLRGLGFQVRETSVELPERAKKRMRSWRLDNAETARATNIIALRPGRDPAAPAVAIMAHYDSVADSPGAADDAAGVASALEIARAIPQESQARDLVILLTDGEEVGLVGARNFFAPGTKGDPLAARIGALVNLETRGGGGRAFMFETGPENGGLIDLYRRSVTNPSTTSMAVKVYQLLPNSTDFTPAAERGITGFNFAFSGDAGMYHSPLITPDTVEQGAIQHLGGQGLDVVRALLTEQALPAPAPDVVFSDFLGLATIAYPPAIGWLLIAAAGVAILLASRRADTSFSAIAGGVFDAVIFTAVVGVLLYFGNLLSGADAPGNYYDRLAALPRLETQALLLGIAGLALTLAIIPRRRSLWDGWIGLALINLIIAVAAQIMLPAAGPVFTWPLLLAGLAMALTARAPRAGIMAAMAVAILGIAWLGGFVHAVMLSVGGDIPSAAAAFAPMTLLLLWPLLPHPIPRRALLLFALAMVLAAGAVALWVRLDPMAASIPPWPPRA